MAFPDLLNAANAAPAEGAFAITPNDSTTFSSRIPRSIYIGGDGALSVVTAKGDSVVFAGLTAGSVVPVRCTKVLATGTTATAILGLD